MGSRWCFLAGFVVGTVTLYVFLRQVWLDRNMSVLRASTLEKLQKQQAAEEEEKVWKKERSALFNLQHPHHSGETQLVLPSLWFQSGDKPQGFMLVGNVNKGI